METLIALGVGGLILVFALQAIPALQRSSRNNVRKQDVGIILDRISRYQLNNSGSFPTDPNLFASSKLQIYVASPVLIAAYPAVEQPATGIALNYTANPDSTLRSEMNPNTESVWIYNRRKCDTVTFGRSTSQGAGFRDIVALYAVEGRNNHTSQCRQL